MGSLGSSELRIGKQVHETVPVYNNPGQGWPGSGGRG